MASNSWMYGIGALGAGVAGYVKGLRQREFDDEDREDRRLNREKKRLEMDEMRRKADVEREIDELTRGASLEEDEELAGAAAPAGGPAPKPGVDVPPSAQAAPRRGGRRGQLSREYQLALRTRNFAQAAALRQQYDAAVQSEIFNNAVNSYTPEAASEAIRLINRMSPTVTIAPHTDGSGRPTGYMQLVVVKPDHTAVSQDISPAQARTLYGAAALIQSGYAEKGLEYVNRVSQEFAAALANDIGLKKDVVSTSNEAQAKYDLAEHYRRADANQARMARAHEAASRLGRTIEGFRVAPDGTMRPSYFALAAGRNGVEFQELGLPQNFIPLSAFRDADRAIQGLVGTPMPGLDDTGQPRMHDYDTASDAVMNAIKRRWTGSGPSSTGGQIVPLGPRVSKGSPRLAPAPESSGQTKFGPLTPRFIIEREVAAGNKAALDYLNRLAEARAEDERYRLMPGFGGQ